MPTRHLRVLTAIAAIALVAGACGSSGSTAEPRDTTTTTRVSTTTTTSAGGETQWRDDTAHWKQLVPGPLAMGRAAVADELAARYRGGDTSEVGQVAVADVGSGEPLVVVLRETGVSDGIPGRDLEVTLEGGDEGWSVASARVRDQCVAVSGSDPTQCS